MNTAHCETKYAPGIHRHSHHFDLNATTPSPFSGHYPLLWQLGCPRPQASPGSVPSQPPLQLFYLLIRHPESILGLSVTATTQSPQRVSLCSLIRKHKSRKGPLPLRNAAIDSHRLQLNTQLGPTGEVCIHCPFWTQLPQVLCSSHKYPNIVF